MGNKYCINCNSDNIECIGTQNNVSHYKCNDCGEIATDEDFSYLSNFKEIVSTPREIAEESVYYDERSVSVVAIGPMQSAVAYWTSPYVNKHYLTREKAVEATIVALNNKLNRN
jgi:hypothetical protein